MQVVFVQLVGNMQLHLTSTKNEVSRLNKISQIASEKLSIIIIINKLITVSLSANESDDLFVNRFIGTVSMFANEEYTINIKIYIFVSFSITSTFNTIIYHNLWPTSYTFCAVQLAILQIEIFRMNVSFASWLVLNYSTTVAGFDSISKT